MTIEIAVTGERQPPVRLHVEYDGGTVEAANQIILALEARGPVEDSFGVFFCPACRGVVKWGWVHCPWCGQKLLTGEEAQR